MRSSLITYAIMMVGLTPLCTARAVFRRTAVVNGYSSVAHVGLGAKPIVLNQWDDELASEFSNIERVENGGSRDVFTAQATGPVQFTPAKFTPAVLDAPVVLKFLHDTEAKDEADLQEMWCSAVNLPLERVAKNWPKGFGEVGTSPARHFTRCLGSKFIQEGQSLLVLERAPGKNLVQLLLGKEMDYDLWRGATLQFLDILAILYDAGVYYPGEELHPPQLVMDPAEKILRLVDTDECKLENNLQDLENNLLEQVQQWAFYLIGTPCTGDMQSMFSLQGEVNALLYRGQAKATVQEIAHVFRGDHASKACDALVQQPAYAALIYDSAYRVSRNSLVEFRRSAENIFPTRGV